MKFVNCTSRTITVLNEYGDEIMRLDPSGIQAGVTMKRVGVAEPLPGIKVVRYNYADPVGLPMPQEGVIYVVSFAVLQALNGARPDVVAPDTAPGSVVRGTEGAKVEGVKFFRVL